MSTDPEDAIVHAHVTTRIVHAALVDGKTLWVTRVPGRYFKAGVSYYVTALDPDGFVIRVEVP